jgi:rhodanese-related sulfurtransferase
VQPQPPPTVSVADVTADTVFLDVREDDEWADGHIDGALHIPMGDIPGAVAAGLDWLTPANPVVVVCAVGARSARVAAWLNAQGYQAINLDGGMNAWIQAGRPIAH